MVIKRFEDLEIWQISMAITKDIYLITANERFSRDWGLRDQIRKAVVSISSNVVEGFEKNNNVEFRRYLKIAKGSCGEVRNQFHIARLIEYLNENEFNQFNDRLMILASKIGSLISYLSSLPKK